MRPLADGIFSREWPELLRTRYECDYAVIGIALQAVRERRWQYGPSGPASARDGYRGELVCDMAYNVWPQRVRAYETPEGILEVWEFDRGATYWQMSGPGQPNRPTDYSPRRWEFEGRTPPLLRLVRTGSF